MENPLDNTIVNRGEYEYRNRYPAIFGAYQNAIWEAIDLGYATQAYVYSRMLARLVLDWHTPDNHPVLDTEDRIKRLLVLVRVKHRD